MHKCNLAAIALWCRWGRADVWREYNYDFYQLWNGSKRKWSGRLTQKVSGRKKHPRIEHQQKWREEIRKDKAEEPWTKKESDQSNGSNDNGKIKPKETLRDEREKEKERNKDEEKGSQRWDGRESDGEEKTGPWPADQSGEQQLQADPPSTCCCPAAKSNPWFQQTNCLMASVERPLLGPRLSLQTLSGGGSGTHTQKHSRASSNSPSLTAYTGWHIQKSTRNFLCANHPIILLHIC